MDLRELMSQVRALPVPPPVSEEALPASLRLPLRSLLENLAAWREFALQVQSVGLADDVGDNLTRRVEQLEGVLLNVRGYGGVEVRSGPAGIAIGVQPPGRDLEPASEGPAGFWAEIVTEVESGEYTFKEKVLTDGQTWADLTDGRSGTVYETNDAEDVEAGAIVRVAVEHDTSGNLQYVFEAAVAGIRYDVTTHKFQYTKTGGATWLDITDTRECDDT